MAHEKQLSINIRDIIITINFAISMKFKKITNLFRSKSCLKVVREFAVLIKLLNIKNRDQQFR